ncbi:MAG: multicopper oxidase domain-containing protein [Actinobacteria bacterium]|nr:multicopper oxidase domain-containing protein [Actinomycetota bacterium]
MCTNPLVHGSSHSGFALGNTTVDPKVHGFDPSPILRDFDWGKTRRLAGGKMLREWELVAYDKEIEIVPWREVLGPDLQRRVPGPTLRANEGDLLRMHFINAGTHPHTIHFHGIHPAAMDGTPGIGEESAAD